LLIDLGIEQRECDHFFKLVDVWVSARCVVLRDGLRPLTVVKTSDIVECDIHVDAQRVYIGEVCLSVDARASGSTARQCPELLGTVLTGLWVDPSKIRDVRLHCSDTSDSSLPAARTCWCAGHSGCGALHSKQLEILWVSPLARDKFADSPNHCHRRPSTCWAVGSS
jgi:hypothetical protein